MNLTKRKSYRDTIRSSYIIASSNVIQYILGFLQIKVAAVILGPSGIGLIAIYKAIVSLIVSISALGISQSCVREVSRAKEIQSEELVKISLTIKRIGWIAGILSWILAIVFGSLISELAFDSQDHVTTISIIGGVTLLTIKYNFQLALLQGMRRIGDLARVNIVSSLINTILVIYIYNQFDEKGIVIAMVATATVSLLVSYFFSRNITSNKVEVTASETFVFSKILIRLGGAFLVGSLVASGTDLAIRSFITREYGLDVLGHYQAAWVISGLFSGLVLTAMGMDYYPRLSAIIQDSKKACNCVSEQLEIGIFLVLPLLIGTIIFSEEALYVLYSKDFIVSKDLLSLFIIGMFGRVISWPFSFILLAKAASKIFIGSEILFGVLNITMVFTFLPMFGLIGVAYAMILNYALYFIFIIIISRKLIDFRFSKALIDILIKSTLSIFISIVIYFQFSGIFFVVFGIIFNVAVFIWCAKSLLLVLEKESKIYEIISSIPILGKFF
jgi:enterobacterial common antigen flippase